MSSRSWLQHILAKMVKLGYIADSEKDKSTGLSDACQQMRMAEAAEGATRYAGLQALLSAASVGLLFWATWYAGRAAGYAKIAAAEAQKGADAAIEAVRTAQQDGRAWLVVESVDVNRVSLWADNVDVGAQVEVRNVGRSIASNVVVCVKPILSSRAKHDVLADTQAAICEARTAQRINHELLLPQDNVKLIPQNLVNRSTFDGKSHCSFLLVVVVAYQTINGGRGLTVKTYGAPPISANQSVQEVVRIVGIKTVHFPSNTIE